MSGLEILAQVVILFSSRSTYRLYRRATLAFSFLESETILNGFLKNASFGPQLNYYTCNRAGVEFF